MIDVVYQSAEVGVNDLTPFFDETRRMFPRHRPGLLIALTGRFDEQSIGTGLKHGDSVVD